MLFQSIDVVPKYPTDKTWHKETSWGFLERIKRTCYSLLIWHKTWIIWQSGYVERLGLCCKCLNFGVMIIHWHNAFHGNPSAYKVHQNKTKKKLVSVRPCKTDNLPTDSPCSATVSRTCSFSNCYDSCENIQHAYYIYNYIYIYIYMYMRVSVCVCVRVCSIGIYMNVYIYICVCVCMIKYSICRFNDMCTVYEKVLDRSDFFMLIINICQRKWYIYIYMCACNLWYLHICTSGCTSSLLQVKL